MVKDRPKVSLQEILIGILSSGLEGLIILGALFFFIIIGPFLFFLFILNFSPLLSIILNVIYLVLLISLIIFLTIKISRKSKEKRRKELEEKVALKIWLDKNRHPEKYEPEEEEYDPDFKEFMKRSSDHSRTFPEMAPSVPETPEEYYKKRWKQVP